MRIALALLAPVTLFAGVSVHLATRDRADTRPSRPPTATREALPGRATGPVPDYAPTAHVVTHVRLRTVAPELVAALDRHLGPRHVVDDRAPDEEGGWWLRDHQPIYVRRPDGLVGAVRPLHSLPERAHWFPPVREPAIPFTTLPLVHENGNLVATDRHVFVVERLLIENAEPSNSPLFAYGASESMDDAGYRARRPEETLTLLARGIERPARDIVVLPMLRADSTSHVDSYVLALDPKTVVVPRIESEALAVLDDPEHAAYARHVQRYLDHIAEAMDNLGYTLLRLPMLAPRLVESVAGGARVPLFLTPANSLLLDVDGRRVVMLPDARPEVLAPNSAPLQARYLATWRDALTARGLHVEVVDATGLLPWRGLLRCATAVVPAE